MLRPLLSALFILMLVPAASAQQARHALPTESKPLRQIVHDAARIVSASTTATDALVSMVIGSFEEEAKLTASDAELNDFIGRSVSIDGDRAIVASANMNSAYVFFLSDGVWTEEAQLVASGATEESRFGVSASLDGDRAIVGAESDDTDAGETDRGGLHFRSFRD